MRYEPADRLWFAGLASLGAGVPGGARVDAGVAPQTDCPGVGLGESALGLPTDPGELVRLGHPVGSTTRESAAGFDPAPRRSGPTWREFLTAKAEGIIACDFVHIDLVDLRRVYALVFFEHGTRRLLIARGTAHPTGR
ncbi:hypothetical protein [Streptomyces sp. NPDC058297]|uniref:hypothetical protein n=1 Tax=Streptomyces sp. NPDC058297 TaxID=3346433 RepID=UPI0036E579BB